MTNLNYKDESNCILLVEVFDIPKAEGRPNGFKKGGQRVIQKKKGGKVFSTRKGQIPYIILYSKEFVFFRILKNFLINLQGKSQAQT